MSVDLSSFAHVTLKMKNFVFHSFNRNSMNTYLSLLDRSSIFELLLRLHYPDLIAVCKSHNYLYKITTTPWFQEKWKEYNITTEIVVTRGYYNEIDIIQHKQVDRQGMKHGLTLAYFENGFLLSKCDYIQDVKNGYETVYVEDSARYYVTPYVNDMKHGQEMRYYEDDTIIYTSYIDGSINRSR